MRVSKHRGSRFLALTQQDFERDYPQFAADVSSYIVAIRDHPKQLKCSLSVRLFAQFITIEPDLDWARKAFGAPGSVAPSSLEQPLFSILKRAHERLENSGHYSTRGALAHARNIGGALRWLGKTFPTRYPAVKRITWRSPEHGDTRKDRSATILFKPLTTDDVKVVFGVRLAADIDEYQAKNGAKSTLGFRKVLSWLHHHYRDEGAAVVEAYQNGGCASCDPAAVKSAIDEWAKATAKSGAYSPITLVSEKRYAAMLFEHLGSINGRQYPKFSSSYVKSKYVAVESKSLADAELPGTRNLTGAARLRQSLKIVMDEAFAVLRRDRHVFDLLAPARENAPPDNVDLDASIGWQSITAVMRAEIYSLLNTGKSQFSTQGARTNTETVDRALKELVDPARWCQIGLPEHLVGDKPLRLSTIRSLICRGIGAPRSATIAAKLIFACDKGWNRQPIEDVPADIYAFQIGNQFGIASATFLNVFKNRAGHDVLSLLEHGHPQSTGRREAILAAWEQAEDAVKWLEMDERSLTTINDPTYEAIELIRPLVEPLAAYTNDADIKQRFFKFLGWSDGVSMNDRDIRASFRSGILGSAGVTFPAARKTVLQLKAREVGSIAALRHDAGHRGPQVLLQSYLNSPSMMKELWQATRFFQNAVEALTIAGAGCKIETKLSADDQDWFFRLAHASGIASAVGFGVSTPIKGPTKFEFNASAKEMRGLVSLHLALILERPKMAMTRRLMIAIPLLGFVIALKRALRKAGLGTVLNDVSRQLLLDLRSGLIMLPTLRLQGHLKK